MADTCQEEYKVVVERPKALLDRPHHYCPGCTHGVLHRLVAEMIDEFGIIDNTIGVCPVGCSVLAYDYFACDMLEASHGRAPAVATGIKRCLPDSFVFSYQGDGDLASIGMGETVHAAARGENFTIIFVNNGIYGMTGGQMAPTTLSGQKSTTSPYGRDTDLTGFPIDMSSLLATLPAVGYLARINLTTPQNFRKAKKYVRKAFQCQIEKKGFSMVEVLAACPVQWKMKPADALKHVNDNVVPVFPTGELVNKVDGE